MYVEKSGLDAINYSISQASAEDDEKQASSSDGSDCNGTDSNDNDDDNNDGGDGDEGVDNVESGNPTELQEGGNLSLRSEVAEVICSCTCCKKLYQNRRMLSNDAITIVSHQDSM